jgi:hypothetical protein
MEAVDVNAVVDKLAQKLSIAADNILPVAEQTIDQYATRAGFLAIMSAVLFVVFSVVVIIMSICLVKELKVHYDAYEETRRQTARATIFGIIVAVSGIGCIVSVIQGLLHMGRWLAPLPSILGL